MLNNNEPPGPKLVPETVLKEKAPEEKPDKKPEEQACQVDIVAQGNNVVIQFGRPVRRLTLAPDQALGMSQALVHCAKLARSKNKKLIVVPG